MVEELSQKGGCYGSSDLTVVAYRPSWSKNFCENRMREAKTGIRLASAHMLSIQEWEWWFVVGLCKQALRYALIVLPYGQHRASLRACLHD